MRILLTADPAIPVPPVGYGGIERIVDSLARYLLAEGHEVGLIAHPDSACPVTKRFSWSHVTPSTATAHLRNTIDLWKTVWNFRPDLVHSFSRLLYLAPILPGALPKIMSYQRHTSPRQSALAARLARRDALTFTACSEFIHAMAASPGTRWEVIPNFVECAAIRPADSVPADAPLLFLSRIESIKGPDLAIAVAKKAGRRLILAGNLPDAGAERDFWEQKIKPEIGRNQIEYVGEVNDRRKYDLLRNAAALIVPIQWDEPFGIVFIEALATGTPIITCPRGALPFILRDGITGFFMNGVDNGVAAVAKLPTIKRPACRADALERFDSDVCCGKYLELYRSMLFRQKI